MSAAAMRAPGTRGGDGFAGKVAVLIALLATLGTMFGFIGSAAHNNATIYKSNAAIDKTSAANAWGHYQAKASRQNLAELAASLPGTDRERYRVESSRYGAEKAVIRARAERFEASSADWNARSEKELHRHRQWAAASVAQQIAISLAAITLLSRRTWLLTLTSAVAAFGITLALFAAMHAAPAPLSAGPLLAALGAAALTEALRRVGRRLAC
jgi:energy-coupling factor transporter transmembrane protein EcfT